MKCVSAIPRLDRGLQPSRAEAPLEIPDLPSHMRQKLNKFLVFGVKGRITFPNVSERKRSSAEVKTTDDGPSIRVLKQQQQRLQHHLQQEKIH